MILCAYSDKDDGAKKSKQKSLDILGIGEFGRAMADVLIALINKINTKPLNGLQSFLISIAIIVLVSGAVLSKNNTTIALVTLIWELTFAAAVAGIFIYIKHFRGK